jgi:hypothetical protein
MTRYRYDSAMSENRSHIVWDRWRHRARVFNTDRAVCISPDHPASIGTSRAGKSPATVTISVTVVWSLG